MEQGKQIRLTSGELTELTMQYMQDSANICTLTYFLKKVKDTEIKPIIKYALEISQEHVENISAILTEDKHKIPYGFKLEEDIDVTAPRLYVDGFMLIYIYQMASIGLTMYAASLSSAVRSDITNYYKKCLSETVELYEMSKDLLLAKGLYLREPSLPNLDEVEFVEK